MLIFIQKTPFQLDLFLRSKNNLKGQMTAIRNIASIWLFSTYLPRAATERQTDKPS